MLFLLSIFLRETFKIIIIVVSDVIIITQIWNLTFLSKYYVIFKNNQQQH